MKILFVINPTAGKGITVKSIPIIEGFCREHQIEAHMIKTTYCGHAAVLTRDALLHGYDIITAVGGDGTVLEVANGLMGSMIPLGILPAGTGNDLARSLKIPDDIHAALTLLITHKPYPIDIASVGDCYFLNVASVGLDAEIARDVAQMKKWAPGRSSYYLSVFKKLLTYKCKDVTVKLDETVINRKVLLVAVGNGCYYGGGMKVNPLGSLSDGTLDVILIRSIPRYKIPFLFKRFVKGKHLDLSYVEYYQCRNVCITSKESLVVNGDGEIVSATPIEISLHPLAIQVIGAN